MLPRGLVAVVAVLLPVMSAAQGAPVPLPKALLFPNYDNVLLGKDQALEAGAYIARAGDASANFYNPAGLVQSEKTSLNASSAGWVQTKLTSEALNTSVSSSRIDGVPGYFGAVIDPPWLGMRNLRLGLSITRTVAWSPGGLDQSLDLAAGGAVNRLTYSSLSNFSTQVYQLAAAWAPVTDRSLRLGLSVGMSNTSYSASTTLSGGVSVEGQPGQFLATLRSGGSEWDLVFGVGAQWDVTDDLTVGALVRLPGLRTGGSALVTYESAVLTPNQSTTSYYRDDAGRFEYKQPLEASVGISYRLGPAQLEADLRYHDAAGTYDFYQPSKPIDVVTQVPGGGTTSSPQTLASIQNSTRSVWNLSLGGNYKIGRLATLHAGFFTSNSPVDDATKTPFRKGDLYGVTGGVDVQLEHFGASLGAGYQWGESTPVPITIGPQTVTGTGVKLQSISLLYAISYQF